MELGVETFGWICVIFFQLLFVLRGLPCFQAGQHYVNCLLLKIKFSFCLLCLQLTITIFSYATLYNQNNIIYLAFPFALFILLKMTSQYLLYRPVKYKDDGRDIVSFLDFVTIHVTFPSINAWISYQLYYSVALTSTVVCKTSFIDQSWLNFCEGES